MNKIFAAVFGLLFFIFNTCAAYTDEGKLRVTMLDVGQGDAFLVETPTQNILIDTGDIDANDKLLAGLNKAGVNRLERVILTHPHADHIGGIQAVLKNFLVDEIIDNGIASSSPLYKNYRNADVQFSTLKAGDIVDFGGGVQFKVLYPTAELVKAVTSKSQRSKPNNESIVGKLTFGDFSMLFTGDAEKAVEDEILSPYLKATILKAGHHGSRTSSSANFIANVRPEYVFISAGKNNRFGHPHNQALENYRVNFVIPEKIFCTAFNGSVVVETDGLNHIVLPERFNDWVESYSGEIITVTRLG